MIEVLLLERGEALHGLSMALSDAAQGNGRIVLVFGEAGIGKTSLIGAFESAHRPIARFLIGRCDSLMTPQPLSPLHDIAEECGDSVANAMRAGDRIGIFRALLDDFRSSERPTVLVFEDVHWADAATLDLLKYLGRRIANSKCVLVLTYRPEELDASHTLWSVLGHLPPGAVRRIALPPLSEAAVGKLARSFGRSERSLYSLTAGNPFFVTEILANPPGQIPLTVREATLSRAINLSPAARDVLDLCSIAPNRIERWLVERICPSGAASIDECAACGLIVQNGDFLEFRHELARLAVEAELPAGRRQALHKSVLTHLLENWASAPATARLVHHASGANDRPSVLRYAPEAARHAAAFGAHRDASAHYRTAIRLTPREDKAGLAELLEARAYEDYLIDRMDDALQARNEALALRRELGEARMIGDNLRWLARLSYVSGRGGEARRFAEQAVATLETLPACPELAMAYSTMAQLRMHSEDNAEAIAWGRKALPLAERFELDETIANTLNNIGLAQFFMGDDAGRATLEQALALALEKRLYDIAARTYVNLAYQAIVGKDYRRALRAFEDGLNCSRERDLDFWTYYMIAQRARANVELGNWQAAIDDAQTVLANAPAAVSRLVALVALGNVRARRGEPGAMECLDQARALALSTGDILRIHPMAVARAEAAWLKGDRESARAEVEPAYEMALQRPEAWRLGELSVWMWRVGGLDRAAREIAAPYRLEIEGDWRGAAAAWESIGCPYERALALSRGDRDAQLKALEIFRDLGAGPAAALVRDGLRAKGEGRIPRGPNDMTRRHPLGLTGRQAEILDLIAQNLTNKEIAARLGISPKTVDHHIGAIFDKLGVSTRKMAAAHPAARALLSKNREPEMEK